MDLTKEDWIKVHRESSWYNDLRINLFAKFLQIDSKKVLSTHKKYEGSYHKNITVACFEDFLKENGYIIVDNLGIEGNDYFPLRKEDIEIRPGVFKRCITEGLIFLEKDSHRCILEFETVYGRDAWHANIYYDPDRESDTLKFLTDLEEYSNEHNYLKNAKIDPSLKHIKIATKYTWDDVILTREIREEIQKNVDNLFANIDIYKQAKLTFKRGIILQGLPGTGKTLIGKMLCQTCNCSFVWVTPKFLTRADDIAAVCQLVRSISPAILFLEDIDLYGEHRDDSRDRSILGELMNQLDGLIENEFVVVIATTNDVESIEKALQNRPGRFDRIIELPIPNLDCRIRLLELYTKSYIKKNINLKSVAKHIDKFSSAHVKELVNTAVIAAIDEKSIDASNKIILTNEHFKGNIEKVRGIKIEPTLGFTDTNTKSDVGVPTFEDD